MQIIAIFFYNLLICMVSIFLKKKNASRFRSKRLLYKLHFKGSKNKIIIIENNKEYVYRKYINISPKKLKIEIIGMGNELILHYPLKLRKNKINIKNDFNQIAINENSSLSRVHINIEDNFNKISINEKCCLVNMVVFIDGDSNELLLKKTCDIKDTIFYLTFHDKNKFISIGENVCINSGEFLALSENTKILIGDNCMLSTGIIFRTDDSHVIFDKNNKYNVVNIPGDVIIKEHVWICADVCIGKNVTIGANNILAFSSIVTKSFPEENVIIAGSPAKIVKRDISWDFKQYTNYLKDLE